MKYNLMMACSLFAFSNTIFGQVKNPSVTPVEKNKQIIISQANAPVAEKIVLEDVVESLCPQTLTRGDREFDGNGPKIKCRIELNLKNNATEIWAKINFEAKETKQDWSTTSAIFNIKVYTTPYGKRISQIVSDKFSRTEFVSPPAGFQLLVPGEDMKAPLNTFFDGQVIAGAVLAAHGLPIDAAPAAAARLVSSYMKDNQVTVVPSLEGKLVKFFHVVGDTGGEDISNDNNCKDDTRIEKIEFFPLQVIMVNSK